MKIYIVAELMDQGYEVVKAFYDRDKAEEMSRQSITDYENHKELTKKLIRAYYDLPLEERANMFLEEDLQKRWFLDRGLSPEKPKQYELIIETEIE